MTTSSYATTGTDSKSRTTMLAVLGVVASLIATALGTFADLTGNEPTTGEDDDPSVYLVVVGMTLVVALIAYGLVVRTADRGNASRRAAITGVVAAATFVVFWTGAPIVLASAAVACALIDRDRLGSFGTGSKIGLAFAGLATAAAAVLAVVG